MQKGEITDCFGVSDCKHKRVVILGEWPVEANKKFMGTKQHYLFECANPKCLTSGLSELEGFIETGKFMEIQKEGYTNRYMIYEKKGDNNGDKVQ